MTEKTEKLKTEKPKQTEKKVAVKKPETKKSELLAVIKTGGKQYLVEPGKIYDFEKLDAKVGETVTFDEVYLVIDGSDVKIGKPKLTSKVSGKVVEQFKDEKVNVFKYKKRKRIRKTYGHRQPLTKVEITAIK
jgi:large subunit ribosomal protein L21